MAPPTGPPAPTAATDPTMLTADHLEALLANGSDIVVSFDAAGNLVFASQAIRTYLGYDPADLVGRNVTELMHPDEVGDFAGRWSLAVTKQGPTQQPPYRVRHADGSWVAMTIDFLVGDLGPLGVGVATVRPVDRSTHAERELRSRLANEDRLVTLASTFIGLPVERFDDGVQDTLALLGSMRTIIRASIFRIEGDDLVLTHQWQAPGTGGTPLGLRLQITDSPYLVALADRQEVTIEVDESEGSRPRPPPSSRRGAPERALGPHGRPWPLRRLHLVRVVSGRDPAGAVVPATAAVGRRAPERGLRPPRGRGAARLRGPGRLAHRARQPVGLPRGPGRRARQRRRSGRRAGSRCCCSTSTGSRW